MMEPEILIACERSGIVRDAMISAGYPAVSCDLFPSERPGPHHVGDVGEILARPWKLIVAHPDCQHLAASGARHYPKKMLDGRQQRAADFFMRFVQTLIS